MDVAKLDVVDVAENPLVALAAEGELVVESVLSNTEAVALAVSRLAGTTGVMTRLLLKLLED
jgi:hypothetical protein